MNEEWTRECLIATIIIKFIISIVISIITITILLMIIYLVYLWAQTIALPPGPCEETATPNHWSSLTWAGSS